MKPYIAQTLLYDKRLVERADPETGELCQIERGYIPPGDVIELSDDRAEILLATGAIAPAPAPVDAAPTGEPAAAESIPSRRRR